MLNSSRDGQWGRVAWACKGCTRALAAVSFHAALAARVCLSGLCRVPPVTNGVERLSTDFRPLGCPLVKHLLIRAHFSTRVTQDGCPTGVGSRQLVLH